MVLCSTVMAVKIFLFQANNNLIGHLQLESCKMGMFPVQREERKIKNAQIALLLLHRFTICFVCLSTCSSENIRIPCKLNQSDNEFFNA